MVTLQRRRGFSAIEFMVVIGVVAVLIALLLPATTAVREAARRSQCQDVQHNIIIALHNYEGSFKLFPPGFVHQIPQRSNYGWQAMMFPFLEQMPLYKLTTPGHPGLAAGLTDAQKLKGLQTPMTLSVCPTDNAPALNSHFVVTDINDKNHELSTSNYVGNYGVELLPIDLLPKEKRKAAGRRTGLFGENSNTKMRDILDGTSNTIGIGERAWMLPGSKKEEERCGAALVAGVTGDGKVIHQRPILFSSKHGINAKGSSEEEGTYCESGMSSNHPGGVHVGVMDGKVTFLSENIDQDVLDVLTTRDAGETVNIP